MTIQQEIESIKYLTLSICNRIDNLIKLENKMSDNLITALEMASWEMQKQVNDIEDISVRFG